MTAPPVTHLTPSDAGALALKALRGQLQRPARPQTFEAYADPARPRGHRYWRLHGVNYITSPGVGGAWDPLLPELYGGDSKWAEHTFQTRLFRRYLSGESTRLDLKGRAALLWWLMGPEEAFPFVWEGRAAVRAPGRKNGGPLGDPDAPNCPELWALFERVSGFLVEGFPQWDRHVPGEPCLPGAFFRGYGAAASRLMKYQGWREKGVEFYPEAGANFWPKR